MKELIGKNIIWNESVEITLTLNGVIRERREKKYYYVDDYKHYKDRFGYNQYEYILIALDGTGRKSKVHKIIFEDEVKKGNIKEV